MRNIFLALFLLSSYFLNAQQEDVNTFQQSENQATGTSSSALSRQGIENQTEDESGPGNPPGDDEIPIDDYLPILAIVGTALVIYQFKSKKSSTL
ncbi:hypothetical protein GCM10010992_27070 [Cloacibacterium rupense]|uniref:Signal peptidase n=1 Tax=Cloacibacterium rupense TaxID=517423 RepID=A0ABQ2NMZ1_9FLAO|nr:hypothetical protein [Cloacibacterium rupense]GGP06564.1 hypothetical protein GCM10010992_27070 [Cloacibacterium rupense]